MDRELLLIITGAGISLLSGIMTLILQHFLSLRADRFVRARVEREDKQKRCPGRKLHPVSNPCPVAQFCGRIATPAS
jgi:hypothetical protein